jgi:hypothetical protein
MPKWKPKPTRPIRRRPKLKAKAKVKRILSQDQ